jgi:hypothetical protein
MFKVSTDSYRCFEEFLGKNLFLGDGSKSLVALLNFIKEKPFRF